MRNGKQFQAVACAALAVFGIHHSASADQLIYEPFDYTAGLSIQGQANPSSGTTWVGAFGGQTGAPENKVLEGSLTSPATMPPAVGNSGDFVNGVTSGDSSVKHLNKLRFGSNQKFGASTTLYYSTLLQIPDLTGLTVPNTNNAANNDPLIMFGVVNSGGTDLGANWAGELVIRLGATAGTYNLGIRASNISGTQYWSGDINPSTTTHLVVVRFTQGTNNLDATLNSNAVWIDPSSTNFAAETAPTPDGSTLGTASTTNAFTVNGIEAGAYNAPNNQPNHWYLDDIRVGTTWADVTPVPEPAALSLFGIAALGLLRRRKR
jgi:hypothetical protein